MPYLLSMTDPARDQLRALDNTPVSKQIKKALGYLEANPRHPSFHPHEFTSLKGINILQNLLEINLSSNNLISMAGIESLYKLEYLNLSCNKI